jgi:hypothetical protein
VIATSSILNFYEFCTDETPPSKEGVLHYSGANPDFRSKLLETYHALPYTVQARADMFSTPGLKVLCVTFLAQLAT